MISKQYAVQSLELHLFHGRIMMEHALFLEAGFAPPNASLANSADRFKTEFEKLLQNAIRLSDGVVSADVLRSGELVTDYTSDCGKKTQRFTGIAINQNLTAQIARLRAGAGIAASPDLTRAVRQLNLGAMELLAGFIDFKSQVLGGVLSCNIFTKNYPLTISHLLREAKLYHTLLTVLESGQGESGDIISMELFWNQIMMEHGLFIRGLLDPSEGELINTANGFAVGYDNLIEKAQSAADAAHTAITDEALTHTERFRDFKAAGTEGIAECKIRSIILPLLSDHALREANHYIRLLEQAQ